MDVMSLEQQDSRVRFSTGPKAEIVRASEFYMATSHNPVNVVEAKENIPSRYTSGKKPI